MGFVVLPSRLNHRALCVVTGAVEQVTRRKLADSGWRGLGFLGDGGDESSTTLDGILSFQSPGSEVGHFLCCRGIHLNNSNSCNILLVPFQVPVVRVD